MEQEGILLAKFKDYAERGSLLTPSHITQLVTALAGHSVGRNWTSTFLQRHKNRFSLKFYRVQAVARLNADTPSNMPAFYSFVCLIQRDWSRTDRVFRSKTSPTPGLYTPSNVYNMDECAFNLSSDRKTRRVAPFILPSKSKLLLPPARISRLSLPFPPLTQTFCRMSSIPANPSWRNG